MSEGKTRLDPETLFDYAEGELSAAERERVETLLRDDPEAARQVAEHRRIARLLAEPHPDVAGLDLASAIQARVADGQAFAAQRVDAPAGRPEVVRRWQRKNLLTAGLAAAAVLGVAIAMLPTRARKGREPSDLDGHGFTERSAGGSGSEAAQGAGVQVRRVGADGHPEVDPTQIAVNDRLLFSYTNIGAEPFAYLMIVGVDASGQARWYYPAYEQAGTDPISISLQPGGTTLLPDQIAHEYAPGPLTIHALFTRRPLHVSEVERWLRGHAKTLEELAGEGASLQISKVNVTR